MKRHSSDTGEEKSCAVEAAGFETALHKRYTLEPRDSEITVVELITVKYLDSIS